MLSTSNYCTTVLLYVGHLRLVGSKCSKSSKMHSRRHCSECSQPPWDCMRRRRTVMICTLETFLLHKPNNGARHFEALGYREADLLRRYRCTTLNNCSTRMIVQLFEQISIVSYDSSNIIGEIRMIVIPHTPIRVGFRLRSTWTKKASRST